MNEKSENMLKFLKKDFVSQKCKEQRVELILGEVKTYIRELSESGFTKEEIES